MLVFGRGEAVRAAEGSAAVAANEVDEVEG